MLPLFHIFGFRQWRLVLSQGGVGEVRIGEFLALVGDSSLREGKRENMKKKIKLNGEKVKENMENEKNKIK